MKFFFYRRGLYGSITVILTLLILVAGCKRIFPEQKKHIFIVGDNTVVPDNQINRSLVTRLGSEIYNVNAVGWGKYFAFSTDSDIADFSVIGGRYSTRTLSNGRKWKNVISSIKSKDIVIINLSSFENNPIIQTRDNRAAGVLPGTGEESKIVENKLRERTDTVYTYGYYLNKMIRDVKSANGIPVVISSFPSSKTNDQFKKNLSVWAKEVAKKNNAIYIDLYEYVSDIYKTMTDEAIDELYIDNNLTNKGAYFIAGIVHEKLKNKRKLKKYLGGNFPSLENRPTLERQRNSRPVIVPKLHQDKDHIKEPYTVAANLSPRQMEKLGRGLVAFKQDDGNVFISWRMSGTDASNVAFNLYRRTEDSTIKVNDSPIADVTWFVDSLSDGTRDNEWFVKTVMNGKEVETSGSFKISANSTAKNYLSIPLNKPEGYKTNDASIADLDGDGEYEIIVKWEVLPYDNAKAGIADGTTKIDTYKLDGTFLWRIDLGPNIREGEHYTHFMVYDFDGDGKAELICKTAEGTIDGLGNVITDEKGIVNYYAHPETGYILDGPEYFSVFDGKTGKELAREKYIERGPKEDWPKTWGDSYGNRMDRFLAGVGYFDGQRPSVVLCRGYYGRIVVEAWNWRDGELTRLWRFDTDDGSGEFMAYKGQGNHNLSIGDVDGDGKDEIIYGACAIDSDGRGLYTTGLGHGDVIHLTDHDPDRPGLEVFQSHESYPNTHGMEMRDARTGESLWGVYADYNVGMAMAVDIDPRYRGSECWGPGTALYSVTGDKISDTAPFTMNFAIWWDGDLLRELVDKNFIAKWNWENSRTEIIFIADGCRSNNGAKATPAISADIFGDWREELVFPTEDDMELRIFSTTIPTEYRFYTFMHDPVYRIGVACQNTGFNQPPHVSFFLGDGTGAQPKANIYYPD